MGKGGKSLTNLKRLRGELSLASREHRATVTLSGDWLKTGVLRDGLTEWPGDIAALGYDCERLGRWDSTLLTVVQAIDDECRRRGIAHECAGLPPGVRRLLALSSATEPAGMEAADRKPSFHLCRRIGQWTLDSWNDCRRVMLFTGELTLACARLCLGKARIRFRDLAEQLMKAGPRALAIVSLISFLMGMILAFIGSIPLSWFSAQVYVASLIGIGMLRLMVPVMVGVVMAGRTGATFAAELGTMQVNEELDAFRTLGIDPMEFLVLPRGLALVLMMPVLYVYADIVGVLGGMVVAVAYMKVSAVEFQHQLVTTTAPCHLVIGLVTTIVFGVLVTACGCYHGIHCGRNAESVGRAATAAVVSSIVCMVLAISAITVITVLMGIY